MKKKIFGSIAILLLTATIAFNVNLNLDKKETSLLVLSNVEALADWETFWDTFIDYFDSNVYKCVERACSFSFKPTIYGISFGGWETEGITEDCQRGSDFAHCWNCSFCDAPLI